MQRRQPDLGSEGVLFNGRRYRSQVDLERAQDAWAARRARLLALVERNGLEEDE
ncbi:MAG: hypothetical protein ACLP9Y_05230 [Mycobacterium sp.]